MIVIDSSALLCLLFGETQADDVASALEAASQAVVAAPTKAEAFIVAEARLGPQGTLNLQRILRIADIAVIPFDDEDAEAALEAWRLYGRGRHPAVLNLGDCYSYAAAKRAGVPLLFVGNDFAKTDVMSVL